MKEELSEHSLTLVREALEAYGFLPEDAVFIRHNENLTYQVGEKYLLRVHAPREGFTPGPIYEGLRPSDVRSGELRLLTHLHSHGMNVQTPASNRWGETVTILSDGTLATVLHWLPGRTLKKEDLDESFCRELGHLLGRMHRAAADFPPTPALWYDAALCRRLENKLTELGQSGTLDEESVRDMDYALQTIAERLEKTNGLFLPVHADLSLSNLLRTPDGPAPIDFSLFGYGHPMMDPAELFCVIYGAIHRQWVLEGYRAEGGTVDETLLDACFALNILLGIILHCESWTGEDWFPAALARWRRDDFRPLAEGKNVVRLTPVARPAEEKQIPGWLRLVESMAEAFPGLDMADYERTLRKNIARSTALGVWEDGQTAGVLLFSPNQRCLSFLAVNPAYRRRGVASALIAEMCRRMPEGEITVTTYREGDPLGEAARPMYIKAGFVPAEFTEEFGYPVQVFRLRQRD